MKLEHSHHFGVTYGTDILNFKSKISNTCLSFLKWKEKHLEMNCTRVWWQRNSLGETFLFGRFVTGNSDWIPVTLAYYYPNVGWITQRRDVQEFKLSHLP